MTFFLKKKTFKNPRAFYFDRTFFGVFSRAPSNTFKKKISKIVLFLFQTSMKNAFCISSRYLLQKMHWCCQEKVIYSLTQLKISVSYLSIFSVHYKYVGCPQTHWVVTTQIVKVRTTFLHQMVVFGLEEKRQKIWQIWIPVSI